MKDMLYVQNILNAHKTVPAVNLHCAMHCYRTGTDDWFKFISILFASSNCSTLKPEDFMTPIQSAMRASGRKLT